MVRKVPPLGPAPGRVLGLYALAVMDRDGPLYGYQLADRVSDRTDGAWRPGPGAIYPALAALAERGLARARVAGRRRVYSITPTGRALLRGIRRMQRARARPGPDFTQLWAEIGGNSDVGQHVLQHLRRHLDHAAAMFERDPRPSTDLAALREQLLAELAHARRRIESAGRSRRGTR